MGVAGKQRSMASEVKQLRERIAFLEDRLLHGGVQADEEGGNRSRHRRRQARTESDDEEAIPEHIWLKMEKVGRLSATAPMETSQHASGKKRKQTHMEHVTRESYREYTNDGDDHVSHDDYRLIGQKKQKVRPPLPAFKPLPKTSLPPPSWTQTEKQTATSSFRLPTSNILARSLNFFSLNTTTARADDHGPTPFRRVQQTTQPGHLHEREASIFSVSERDATPPPNISQYAETTTFDFLFVASYTSTANHPTTPELYEFHHSNDLADTMSAFWSILDGIESKWESLAGTKWAWELQKAGSRRRRCCVSSKLAKLRTFWRRGDAGFFACKTCTREAKPCFTWVQGDEEGEGEFWCLPVHPDDRRCEVVEGKEMRTWVNEAEDEESESESESESEEERSGEEVWDGGYDGLYDYGLGSDGAESQGGSEDESDDEGYSSEAEAGELDSGEEEDLYS